MKDNMELKFEYWSSIIALRDRIKECEGNHVQQVVFSTYHGALTQVCFGCKKVRSNIKETDLKSN